MFYKPDLFVACDFYDYIHTEQNRTANMLQYFIQDVCTLLQLYDILCVFDFQVYSVEIKKAQRII